MNNLHRHLAPISSAAWAEIEDEAARTIRRHLAGRRVVDTSDPKGTAFAGVGTGRAKQIETLGDGVRSVLRDVLPLVELRVPFTVSRDEIDAVERGSLIQTGSQSRTLQRKLPLQKIAPFLTDMPQQA